MMRAMILAAGRGERMRPLTDRCPKPLLEVGGKPLIVWQVERLAAAGIDTLVVNHAHLGHMLEEALGDGRRWHVSISYSAEGEPLETAGGIAQALDRLGHGPFLVANGDVFCDLDLRGFVERALTHLSHPGHLAHLALVDNPAHHPAGDFHLDADVVTADGAPRLTFSGIAVYSPELFAGLVPGTRAALAPLLRNAMDRRAVTGEHHRGDWEDIGTPERLLGLDRRLRLAPHHS